MTGPTRLILASSSPFRRSLLDRLGLGFASIAPAVDETAHPGEEAPVLALRLAIAKARAVEVGPALIIGSDQAPALNGRILRKPGSREATIGQLAACQGKTVHFHTAVCLRDAGSGREWTHLDTTRVSFTQLTRQAIESYVDREQPYQSAGGFKAEGLGIALFSRIYSEDPTGLIGLPLIALSRMLREAGMDPLNGGRGP